MKRKGSKMYILEFSWDGWRHMGRLRLISRTILESALSTSHITGSLSPWNSKFILNKKNPLTFRVANFRCLGGIERILAVDLTKDTRVSYVSVCSGSVKPRPFSFPDHFAPLKRQPPDTTLLFTSNFRNFDQPWRRPTIDRIKHTWSPTAVIPTLKRADSFQRPPKRQLLKEQSLAIPPSNEVGLCQHHLKQLHLGTLSMGIWTRERMTLHHHNSAHSPLESQ